MTLEQKKTLLNHVERFGPASTARNADGDFFMIDGEVVEFTNCTRYAGNSKFEINNDPSRMIWFSQLNRIFIDDDFNLKRGIIKIGGEEKAFGDYRHHTFWRAIRGRKYLVHAEDPSITFNTASSTLGLGSISPSALILFVKKSVQENEINLIGDMLKISVKYDLIEI